MQLLLKFRNYIIFLRIYFLDEDYIFSLVQFYTKSSSKKK